MSENISTALAAAQAEMQNPSFDAVNPHFKSRFASLKEVAKVARAALSKHGIFVGQEITGEGGLIYCTTRFLHKSGEALSFGPTPFPVPRNDPQGYGSATTYARRYSLSAALCLVGDDDDDGNAAVAAVEACITKKQAADLTALVDEVGADKARFLKWAGAASIEEIPAAKLKPALALLGAKRAAA